MPHMKYTPRPNFHDPSYPKNNDNLHRDRERMFADLLRRQQNHSSSRQHPQLRNMGDPTPLIFGRSNIPPMMNRRSHHTFSSPMGMPGPNILNINPALSMSSLNLRMTPNLNRPPLTPRRQRHPFAYSSPGPPRTPFAFRHQQPDPSYLRPRHSPFSSARMVFDDEADDGFDYRIRMRRRLGRQMEGRHRPMPRYEGRRYQGGLFEESEDEYDEVEEWEGEYGEEDEFECFGSVGEGTIWGGGVDIRDGWWW